MSKFWPSGFKNSLRMMLWGLGACFALQTGAYPLNQQNHVTVEITSRPHLITSEGTVEVDNPQRDLNFKKQVLDPLDEEFYYSNWFNFVGEEHVNHTRSPSVDFSNSMKAEHREKIVLLPVPEVNTINLIVKQTFTLGYRNDPLQILVNLYDKVERSSWWENREPLLDFMLQYTGYAISSDQAASVYQKISDLKQRFQRENPIVVSMMQNVAWYPENVKEGLTIIPEHLQEHVNVLVDPTERFAMVEAYYEYWLNRALEEVETDYADNQVYKKILYDSLQDYCKELIRLTKIILSKTSSCDKQVDKASAQTCQVRSMNMAVFIPYNLIVEPEAKLEATWWNLLNTYRTDFNLKSPFIVTNLFLSTPVQ